MNTFSRSWELTKLSFGVIQQDKEMLLFPLLGSIFSLIYSFALLFPTVFVHLLDPKGDSLVWGPLQWVVTFASYFGLAFIATFFNTCVVYTTKTRFAGGDATFGESLSFAFSRIHLIFFWSLVSATVGVLLRGLDEAADRMGGIGGMLLNVVQGILGLMWSVVTIFVVPVMVYEGVGPIDAIKRSVDVLKRTWGESLVRHFGLGLAQMLFILPGIALCVLAFLTGPLAIVFVVLGVTWIVVVALTFSVANGVFNTALYEYATTGSVPRGFDASVMQGAFVQGGRRSRRSL